MVGRSLIYTKTFKKSAIEYFTIKQHIFAGLIETGVSYSEILETPEQTYFNELTILVKLKSQNPIEIVSKFNPREKMCNRNIYSFDYCLPGNHEPIQVNFIDVQNLAMAQFYYSYRDVNTIISRLANSTGITYGSTGLLLNLYKNTVLPQKASVCLETLGEIFLSDCPSEICQFFGLDYSTWVAGFTKKTQIFNWLISSPYFQRDLFMIQSRSTKKQLLNDFVQFLKTVSDKTYSDELNPFINLQKTAIEYFDKLDNYISLTQ